jgi:hypothetical protein
MLPSPDSNLTPLQAQRLARVLWGALLLGQIAFATVVIFVVQTGSGGARHQVDFLVWVAAGACVIGIPFGYFIRNEVYKKNWQSEVIRPGGYLTGNLVLWALGEGVALFSLSAALANGCLFPDLLPALPAFAVHLINFPTGKAMFPPVNPYQSS